MKPQVPATEAKTQARRRLLRGTFAAPAVLTVCSGSTFAQAVTSLTCVAKQVNTVKDTANSGTTSTPSTGNWVRVPLQKLWRQFPDGNVDSIWISGAYISANILKSGTTSFVGPSSWLCYRKVDGGSNYNQGQIYPVQPTRNNYTLVPNGEWVAVLVDENGNITGVVGLQAAGPGQYPVHATSCWSSFRPGYVKPWV
jgi:hypothetical protein